MVREQRYVPDVVEVIFSGRHWQWPRNLGLGGMPVYMLYENRLSEWATLQMKSCGSEHGLLVYKDFIIPASSSISLLFSIQQYYLTAPNKQRSRTTPPKAYNSHGSATGERIAFRGHFNGRGKAVCSLLRPGGQRGWRERGQHGRPCQPRAC